MYPSEAKELFYHKGCKFTFQGVDQTLRRPLTVLLFRNCCKRNYVSKDNGQFQKAKLRRARRCSRVWSLCSSIPRLLRVTVGTDSFAKQLNICTPCVQLHCPAGTLHLPQATSFWLRRTSLSLRDTSFFRQAQPQGVLVLPCHVHVAEAHGLQHRKKDGNHLTAGMDV